MTSVLLYAIIAIILICSVFVIFAQYKFAQFTASAIAGKLEELNLALGEAIQMVQSGAAVAQESPLSLILQYLDKQTNKPIEARVVEQDESGKFVKKLE